MEDIDEKVQAQKNLIASRRKVYENKEKSRNRGEGRQNNHKDTEGWTEVTRHTRQEKSQKLGRKQKEQPKQCIHGATRL